MAKGTFQQNGQSLQVDFQDTPAPLSRLTAGYLAAGFMPYLPRTSGLVAWWDAGKMAFLASDGTRATKAVADGDTVGYLYDLSGNGNDFAQSTSGSRPVLRTGTNGIEGAPGLEFVNAGNRKMDCIRAFQPDLVNGFTAYFHVTHPGTGGIKIILGGHSGQFYFGRTSLRDEVLLAGASGTNTQYDFTNAQAQRPQAEVWTVKYDRTAATVTTYKNGRKVATRTGVSGTPTFGIGLPSLGDTNAEGSSGFFWTGKFRMAVIYSTTDSDATVASEVQSILAECNPSTTLGYFPKSKLVFDGNSFFTGYGTLNDGSPVVDNVTEYIRALLPSWVDFGNYGGNGQSTEQMVANSTLKVASWPSTGALFNILVAYEGTNSLRTPLTAENTWESFKTYCAARRSEGWSVVLGTTLTGKDSISLPVVPEAERQKLLVYQRDALRMDQIDALVDLDADPVIGGPSGSDNTRYWRNDKLHLITTGQMRSGLLYARALRDLVRTIAASRSVY